VGSDNRNNPSGSAISASVIAIAKASPTRVLVVPADYTYQPVQQALLPYNVDMLKDLDRLNSLRSVPQWNDVKLLVLNIDPNQATNNPAQQVNAAEDKLEYCCKTLIIKCITLLTKM
jgi:hypothetical protein